MSNVKRIFESIQTTVDKNGEVMSETRSQVLQLPQEPEFVKLYVNDLASVLELDKGSGNVLYALLRLLTFEGYICINKFAKDRISKQLNLKDQSIRLYISNLCKKGILKRVGRAVYEINPDYFAKGDWKNIYRMRKRFKMEITYEDGQRFVQGKSID